MIVIPDKFVFAHMPKTAGMWIRRHLLDHVPGSMEINPRHMPVSDIKTHQSDLPIVAVCRDPVDWIESMYAYRVDRDEWKPETTVIDRQPHGTLDEWVAALIAEHPGLRFQDEYVAIRGRDFAPPTNAAVYLGSMPPQALPFLSTSVMQAVTAAGGGP